MRWPAIVDLGAIAVQLALRGEAAAVLAGNEIDEPEPRVMAGGFVFGAGIS